MENIIQLPNSPLPRLSRNKLLDRLQSLERKMNTFHYNIDLKKIVLNTQDATYLLSAEDILRCEAQGNYCMVYLKDHSSILVSQTLKSIAQKLPGHIFLKTHQSHLVNTNYVNKITKTGGAILHLKGSHEVPISRSAKSHVLNVLLNHLA